ncbi:MAG: transglycosylase, partial [Betaproteobacteria bacterium]|nr:transglycosylase [Betaproteobacteria bacterium]
MEPLTELAAPPPLVALPELEPPAPTVGPAADLDPLFSELAEEPDADPPEGAPE